jgi:hypothetical protein
MLSCEKFRFMKKSIGVILIASLLFSFGTAPKEIKLEYKFAVGDQYAWIMTTKQSITQEIMGMEQNSQNAMSGSLLLKVQSLTPNGAQLEAQYTNLAMLVNLPMGIQSFNFDSEGDQSKTENKVMKAMLNKPFSITITKQGVVENIQGEENLWSDFGNLGLDDIQVNTIKQQFNQYFGKTSVKASFEMGLTNYSDKKVKVGDMWKNKTGMAMNFPLEADNTWTFTSMENDAVNLSCYGIISTTNKDQVLDLPNSVKSKVDLAGSQKLSSVVNPKTGWPNEVKIVSDLRGTMIVLAGGMIPTDLQVPVKISAESNYKVVKK